MLDQLEQAVRERRFVRFYYDGRFRVVKPHCLGIGRKGLPLLRGYQIAGESASGHKPMWRLFDVTKISRLKLLDKTFRGPELLYNPFDRAMKTIFAKI